ncbi:LytR C-terminal domain-containing protein [Streptomyces sp. KK5PA1]|uniref:LytR C-terminal domain-containing protein n=1 Tax=Actinacidiphila acididurans TaxID=2784346 RepID=A0ABS2TQZ2_9ACTN|nr:LytR C-terminal domain-containing protein [Actinacidiphila acididurans]
MGTSVPPDIAEPGAGTAAAPVHVDVPPAQVRVVVENGTDTSGLAATAQRQFAASGFVTPGLPANSAQRTQRTLIRYDPRWDRSARSLAAALPGAQLVAAPGQGPVMNVTLGSDFTRVTPVTAVGAVATPAGIPVSGDQEVSCG